MIMRILLVPLLCFGLAGCGLFGLGGGDGPAATVPNVPRERSVNPAEAARLINAYRAERGRPPLRVDARLSAIAAETARELARRNQVKTEMHTPEGLGQRLRQAGYPAARAAENLGGGYPTLAMAIEGWKDSRGHNRNLIRRDMTHMGIGLAVTDKGKYQSFWVLLVADPDDREGAA